MRPGSQNTTALFALTLFFIIALTPDPGLARTTIHDVDDLKSFMDEVITTQMQAHHVSAAVLSIVQGGDIILSRGYGYTDLESGISVDPELSLFRPGSVSKLFTWTAVMQLVEHGLLDLDVDINEYLDFDIPDRLITSSDPGPITMRHLLTHTAGFEDVVNDLFVLSIDQLMPLGEYVRTNVPARVFTPGTVLAYSNYGTALAGYIVERISGVSYSEYIEQNVFAPLNITSSTFRQPLPDNLAPHMITAYRYANGRHYKGSFEYIPPLPAGSMSCTAVDMAKFMIAHLQDGRYQSKRILEPDTVQEMHRQQFTHHPSVAGVTFGFFEGFVGGTRVLFHGGNTMLFWSQMFLLPDHDLGVFVSYAGGDDHAGTLPANLFEAFMNHYFPHSESPLPKLEADAEQRARGYKGEYHPTRLSYTGPEKLFGLMQSFRVDVNEDGYLTGSIMDQCFEFVEVEPGLFKSVTNGAPFSTIAFTDGPSGRTLLAAGMSTFIKAPWYGTLAFLGGLTLFAIVLMLITLVGWSLPYIFRSPLGLPVCRSARGERIARMVGVAACLTTVTFFFSIFKVLAKSYGIPDVFLGVITPWMRFVLMLPWLLIPLALAMIFFAVAAWRYSYWTWLARLHYSLLAVSLVGVLWVLTFTNAFV